MTVLIAPDKFKGTLSACEAARAIARGWKEARPHVALDRLPMSDGGDGFGQVLSGLLCAKPRAVCTVDAAHRHCQAVWWWLAETKTAIIESANVIGLAVLPPGKYHPFNLDTFGLGAVLRAAHAQGARRILIGIGGSATNDGGFGLARALGWKFLDRLGCEIERWPQLNRLATLREPVRLRFGSFSVAVDVHNRLLGARGATRVYGPQKGLRSRDFAHAELCLRRLAMVVQRELGRNLARVPGTGAAGGLGFGLTAFLGGRLQPGFELFAKHAALLKRLRAADLVVTGEGAIDRSTVMGKGVGQIARTCHTLGIPCVGLAGSVVRSPEVTRRFTEVHALTELTTETAAKTNPARWLERLAARVARTFS